MIALFIFCLGTVSALSIITMIALVVMVLRLNKEVGELKTAHDIAIRNAEEISMSASNAVDDVDRNFKKADSDIYNAFRKADSEIYNTIAQCKRESVEEAKSYMDKRIDSHCHVAAH